MFLFPFMTYYDYQSSIEAELRIWWIFAFKLRIGHGSSYLAPLPLLAIQSFFHLTFLNIVC
jgi:hypothetical protein